MCPRLLSFQSLLDIRSWISVVVLIVVAHLSITAQNLSDVKANQKKLKAEISLTENHLKKLSKDKLAGLSRYNALQQQLQSRTNLVKEYQLELDMISANVIAQEADIKLLKERYDIQKTNFRSSIKEYHNLRTAWSPIAFILSSRDVTTAWKRLTFYQSLSKHHRSQAEKLKHKEAQLFQQLELLKTLEESRKAGLADIELEKERIIRSKKESQSEINRLKKNEQFLQNRLKAQQAQSVKLTGLLQKLVAANIKKRSTNNALPGATKKLNAAFGSNKGKLPWPVSKGYIGDGKVTAVQSVAGFQQTILINHGSYYTVYAHVDNVAVSTGESIKRGQTIAYAASSDSGSSLHFELWKGKTLENPSRWLRSR